MNKQTTIWCRRWLLPAAVLGLLWGCQSAEVRTDVPAAVEQLALSPSDSRDYQTLLLDNGIEVILVSDPDADKAAAALSVGVGLLQDPKSQQGLAHYLEHMLFLGTERYPDSNGYSEFMSKHGGSHNAYTWLDITNYMFKVDAKAYDEALDRFADFFKAPLFTKAYAQKEASAVNAEWSMRREMDFFNTYKIDRSMLGEHPANRFLIGNLETLSDKPDSQLHDELVAFYERYYSANIMKVAMVSNLPIEQMSALAQKHFSTIKNKQVDKPVVSAAIDMEQVGGKLIHYVPLEDKKRIQINFTVENYSNQFASKPAAYLTHLLGSEMPGSPTAVLRELGWISSLAAQASPDLYGNYGIVGVDISLTDEGMKHRESIVGVVFNYLEQLRASGADQRYFEEIQTVLSNQFRFLEKQDAFSYVSGLADSMQKYPLYHVIDAPFYYPQFDAKSVEQLLTQLTARNARVWFISQQEPTNKQLHFYEGKYQIDTLAMGAIAQWQAQASEIKTNLPSINTLLPEAFDIRQQTSVANQPQRLVDEVGLEIWLQPSQYYQQQPKGVMSIHINSDQTNKQPRERVLLSLWADLYNLQNGDLLTEASVAGMSLGVSPNMGMVVSVSGFTDKQPVLVPQVLKGLSKIDLNEQGFSQAVDRYSRAVANQSLKFPVRQLSPNLNRLVNDPNWESEQLIAAAQTLKHTDLEAFIAQLMMRNSIRVFAFGNYNEEDVTRIAGEIKASLPAEREAIAFTNKRVWLPQAQQRLNYQRALDVADLGMLDLHVSTQSSIAEYAAAKVLERHLQVRVFDVLRTEEQLAYAVGAFATQLKDHAAVGFYIQTPVKSPQAMAARLDEFKLSYAKELQQLSAENFDKLKQAILVTLNERPKNLSEELAPLLADWRKQNAKFDSQQRLIEAVEKVTLADVIALYQTQIMQDDNARVLVQLKGEKFADEPFAQLDDQQIIEDVAEFHRQMKAQ